MFLDDFDHEVDFAHGLSLKPLDRAIPSLFTQMIGNFEPIFQGQNGFIEQGFDGPFKNLSGLSSRCVIKSLFID